MTTEFIGTSSKFQRFALTKKELGEIAKQGERAEITRIKEHLRFLPFTSDEQAHDVLVKYEDVKRTRDIKIVKRTWNLLLTLISAGFIFFAVAAPPLMGGLHIFDNIQVIVLAVSTGLGGAFSLTVRYLRWSEIASIYHNHLDIFKNDFEEFFQNVRGKQGEEFNIIYKEFSENFLKTQKSLAKAIQGVRNTQYSSITHSLPEKK